jgi:hypothetical protein
VEYCSKALLTLAARIAAHSSGSLQNARVMQGTIASAIATPSTWEGYAGRNFETELASFLVPGFPA